MPGFESAEALLARRRKQSSFVPCHFWIASALTRLAMTKSESPAR